MTRATLAAFLLAAVCACSMKPPTGPVAGKAYFTQVGCASCHRVGADGGAVGPDLTMVGFRHSDAWLETWLKDPAAWKPGTVMPNKQLSPAARGAIVSYLVTLKGQDWPKGGRPWDAAADPVEKGRLIFLRAGCVACHGQGGAGGYPNNNVAGLKIPSLAGAADRFSKAELVAKIKNGVPSPVKADPHGADPLVFMPTWSGVLDAGEISAVADYVLTLRSGSTEKSDW
ncbi:MAG: cytochrome c [Elusimicrobia bacterium]|nr:cytochrome c [Elusimicrobiota bacterium]